MTSNEPGQSGAGEPERYFFVHLQKTAGTTLFIRLRHHFGDRAVYPMPEYERDINTSIGLDVMLERFAKHRDEIRVITGHFPLCAVEMLDVPVKTFTVLRNPVDRTLSFLRQQQRQTPQFRDQSLEQIYDEPSYRIALLTNYMVRQLSVEVEEVRGNLRWTDVERLDMAKANLTERIDVVGVQEQFEVFCDELSSRFGWDLGEPLRANDTPAVDVPESLRDRIAADNWADVELHRFATELIGSRHRSAAETQLGTA